MAVTMITDDWDEPIDLAHLWSCSNKLHVGAECKYAQLLAAQPRVELPTAPFDCLL